MAQPSSPKPQIQRPYLAHPLPPAHLVKPTVLPQHAKPMDQLQSMLNLMLTETGKTLRSAARRRDRGESANQQRGAIMADTDMLQLRVASSIPVFHTALDDMEAEIVRARAIIGRDLRALRAKKNMTEAEKTVEEAKKVDKEIEAAANAMAEVASGGLGTTEEADGQHANGDLDMHFSADNMEVDGPGTGSGSVQAAANTTEAIQAGEAHLNIPSNSHTLEELRVNNSVMAGDMQQETQIPDTADSNKAPSRPQPSTQTQPAAMPPSMAQVRQMQLVQQRQQQHLQQQQQHQQQQHQQQQQRAQQLKQQRQSQPQPHTPMQQSRTMPEDNIAFGALPGSTTNSPGKATPKKPGPTFLPPASHDVVVHQGGLNIPAESLPLLPEHMRTQMAQVQTQAVLEAKGRQQTGGQNTDHPHIHPEFFMGNTPSAGHTPERNFTPPPQFVNPPSTKPQQQNTSQPQQNQQTLESPFEPQQSQDQNLQQPASVPQAGHDEINFDAMFADGHQDPADAEINFDDFFNDMVGDTTQGGNDNLASGSGHINSGLEGVNESGAADFDLSTFGMDHDGGNAVGGTTLGDLGASTTITDLGGMGGMGNSGGNAGVGLGLGMLAGLESYANQATDDDAMDGLDFGDGTLHNDANLGISLDAHGNVQGGGAGAGASGMDNPFGDANAAAGTEAFTMSNEELDAAMNMSMDQGTTFDDLLDNMDFGHGGVGEGGGAGAETSEFDDAFFGLS